MAELNFDTKVIAYLAEECAHYPEEVAAALTALEEFRLSSASSTSNVAMAISLLGSLIDSDMSDALTLVQRHMPHTWEALGYTMREHTKDEFFPCDGDDDEPRPWQNVRVLPPTVGANRASVRLREFSASASQESMVAFEVFDHPMAVESEDGTETLGAWVLGREEDVRGYLRDRGYVDFVHQYTSPA